MGACEGAGVKGCTVLADQGSGGNIADAEKIQPGDIVRIGEGQNIPLLQLDPVLAARRAVRRQSPTDIVERVEGGAKLDRTVTIPCQA